MAKKFINFIPTFAFLMLPFLLFTQFTTADQSIISKPGCLEKCGEVPIPYPFGIGPNCSLQAGFTIACNMTSSGTYTPFFGNLTLLNVSIPLGQLRANNPVSSQCYDSITQNNTNNNWWWNIYGTQFQFNHEKNKFTIIGCDTLAYLSIYDSSWYRVGCVSGCNWADTESLTNGSCSGIGCCQTAIPKGTNYYNVWFDTNFNNSLIYNFSRCGYAVLMEDAGFEFNTSYITTDYLYKREMPVVLDWTIGNQTCEVAKSNKSSYACVSENSVCVGSWNYSGALGYLCNCSHGYEGNPYLVGGCQDINECIDLEFICEDKICHNTVGSYECFCPPGTHNLSESNGACIPDQKLALWMKLVIGLAIMCVIPSLALVVYALNKMYKKRRIKKTRQKNSNRHNDIIFRKNHDISGRMMIFGIEELEKATNMFDETLIVGRGGHGIIYKGILSDQRIVAIKKPKINDDREIEEFLNEVVIISQLNHKNVVKLFGCCLESEVPLLVYEFISNGTLTSHLHVQEGRSLSWNDRLRIVLEISGALSYLHSATSISIFHRDIKTCNILLNDGLITKLSDFGASRPIPNDGQIETATNTAIQGTLGYLDPEYYQTGRLTTKSDVYSFGIILIEMLTRRKPISNIPNSVSLVDYFSSAIKEDTMLEILDSQIVEEEHIAELGSVATLAEKCVRSKGEERPTMKEVEMRLEVLWSSKHRSAYNWNRDQRLEQQRSLIENQIEGNMSGASSSEPNSMFSSNFPR